MTSTTTIRISHTEGSQQRAIGGFVGALTGATIPEGGGIDQVEISIDDEKSPTHTNIEALGMAAASAYAAAFIRDYGVQPGDFIDEGLVDDEPETEASQGGTVTGKYDHFPIVSATELSAGAAYLVWFRTRKHDWPQTYIFDGEKLVHPEHADRSIVKTTYLPRNPIIVAIRLLADPDGEHAAGSASFAEDF